MKEESRDEAGKEVEAGGDARTGPLRPFRMLGMSIRKILCV